MIEYAIPAVYFGDLQAVSKRLVTEAAEAAHEASPELTVNTHVVMDSARSALIAKSADSSLLVVGASGAGRVAAVVVGSVASAVASHAQCPVVIIRDAEQLEAGPARVTVGVDGSPTSVHAMDIAAEEANARGAELVLVSAWDTEGFDPTDTGLSDARKSITAALHEPIAHLRKRLPDLSITTRVVDGSPQAALTTASEDSELVVVGSRGRGGFAGLLLGSTSQRLLHTAKCPLMIVHG